MAEKDSTTRDQVAALLHDGAAFTRELSGLAKELRGLAREAKAGKAPSGKRLGQIGFRLARLDNDFNRIVLELAGLVLKVERGGLFHIPIVGKVVRGQVQFERPPESRPSVEL